MELLEGGDDEDDGERDGEDLHDEMYDHGGARRHREPPGVDLVAAAAAARRLQPRRTHDRAHGARGRRVRAVAGRRAARSLPAASTAEALPPLYTRAFWTACAVHFTGAMSLAMFVLVPLLIRELGGGELTIGLVLGVATAASVATRPLRRDAARLARPPARPAGGRRGERAVVAALPRAADGGAVALRLGDVARRRVGGALRVLLHLRGRSDAVRGGAPRASRCSASSASRRTASRRCSARASSRAGLPGFLLTASGVRPLSVALTLRVVGAPAGPARRRGVLAARCAPLRDAAAQPACRWSLRVVRSCSASPSTRRSSSSRPSRATSAWRAAAPFFAAYAAMSVAIRLVRPPRARRARPAPASRIPRSRSSAFGLAGLASARAAACWRSPVSAAVRDTARHQDPAGRLPPGGRVEDPGGHAQDQGQGGLREAEPHALGLRSARSADHRRRRHRALDLPARPEAGDQGAAHHGLPVDAPR